MANVGDTRTVQYLSECPNGIRVICRKQQVLKLGVVRTIFWLLTAGLVSATYWDDVPGTAQCPPCPTGESPRENYYAFCCFKSAIVRIWGKAAAPGPVGELGGILSLIDLLRETPTMTVPVLAYVKTDCIALDGDEAKLVLEAMEKALEIMQSTALYANHIPEQKDAIECLKSKMRILGW